MRMTHDHPIWRHWDCLRIVVGLAHDNVGVDT
jgi:hypothetical protein